MKFEYINNEYSDKNKHHLIYSCWWVFCLHDIQEKKYIRAHNLLKHAHDYYFVPSIC